MAHSSDHARRKMAERFPDEVEAGFTVQEWEGFNVVIKEVLPGQLPEEFAPLREIAERQQLSPYPPLKVPDYRVGRYGDWFLDRRDPILIRGYFTGMQPASGNYRLFKRDTLWMSLTPRELESQAHHPLSARGHTVIMGLGMGALLFNVIQRQEVEKVTVVERDRQVVELFHQIANPKTWQGYCRCPHLEAGRPGRFLERRYLGEIGRRAVTRRRSTNSEKRQSQTSGALGSRTRFHYLCF
jgi:hypothetical protein